MNETPRPGQAGGSEVENGGQVVSPPSLPAAPDAKPSAPRRRRWRHGSCCPHLNDGQWFENHWPPRRYRIRRPTDNELADWRQRYGRDAEWAKALDWGGVMIFSVPVWEQS